MSPIRTGAIAVALQRTNGSQGLVGLFLACSRTEAYKNRRKREVRSRSKSELPAGGGSEETFALDTWLWKKLWEKRTPFTQRMEGRKGEIRDWRLNLKKWPIKDHKENKRINDANKSPQKGRRIYCQPRGQGRRVSKQSSSTVFCNRVKGHW